MSNLFVISRSQNPPMSTEIQTKRIHRSWSEKLMLWRAAYQTKIFDDHREAVGRGPTVQASREAALAVWVADWQREHETSRRPL
jgi:hypothetical protein